MRRIGEDFFWFLNLACPGIGLKYIKWNKSSKAILGVIKPFKCIILTFKYIFR